jgi:hypothetical protein
VGGGSRTGPEAGGVADGVGVRDGGERPRRAGHEADIGRSAAREDGAGDDEDDQPDSAEHER